MCLNSCVAQSICSPPLLRWRSDFSGCQMDPNRTFEAYFNKRSHLVGLRPTKTHKNTGFGLASSCKVWGNDDASRLPSHPRPVHDVHRRGFQFTLCTSRRPSKCYGRLVFKQQKRGPTTQTQREDGEDSRLQPMHGGIMYDEMEKLAGMTWNDERCKSAWTASGSEALTCNWLQSESRYGTPFLVELWRC